MFARCLCYVGIVLLCVAGTATNGVAEARLKQAMQALGSNVIFMRHALAPGYGDPAKFDILDCRTQRNLDANGRRQASKIGQILARSDITIDVILSSRWCRCTETAALLGLGSFTTFDGLNSFFNGYVNKEKTLQLLTDYIKKLPPDKTVLLVTHQVVISAITDISPPSGGLVLYNSQTGDAKPHTLR